MSKSLEEVIKEHKHICWYPYAGADFRGLLFLAKWYYNRYNVPLDEGQKMPDLFVMSDCKQPEYIEYADNLPFRHRGDFGETDAHLLATDNWKMVKRLFESLFPPKHTCIIVKDIERLADLDISKGMMFETKPDYYGRCFYMEVRVVSKYEGKKREWSTHVVYVFAETAAFVKEFLLNNNLKTEYLIQIRCGDSLANSGWLRFFFDRLGVKYYIANREYAFGGSSACGVDDLENYLGKDLLSVPWVPLEELYEIDGLKWSAKGPVVWYKTPKTLNSMSKGEKNVSLS